MSELPFHPAARAELIDAILYHDHERPGYGDKFAGEVAALVERIVQLPNSGPLLPDYPPELEVRAYRMKTFRYALMTARVDGQQAVYAVAHERRRPGYFADRLTSL